MEVCEHTGAVRVGTVLKRESDDDHPGTMTPWMVDTGTYPIVWWRPAKWIMERADVRLFLGQPIWKRRRLLLDAGVDVDEKHRHRWGSFLNKLAQGDRLPDFLTAVRALAK